MNKDIDGLLFCVQVAMVVGTSMIFGAILEQLIKFPPITDPLFTVIITVAGCVVTIYGVILTYSNKN